MLKFGNFSWMICLAWSEITKFPIFVTSAYFEIVIKFNIDVIHLDYE